MVSVESSAKEIQDYLSKNCSKWSLSIWDYNEHVAQDIYPVVQEAMQEHMKKGTSNLHYGDTEGTQEYLETLAEFLTAQYNDNVLSSTLFATYGASFGWMMLMTHFLNHGDYVFTEDCSFASVIKASLNYGLAIKTVKTDDEGLVISDFEEKLMYFKKKSTHVSTEEKPFWAIVFLMTVCHNPKGMNYSPERCESIVKLARKYGVLVVTDEVYNFFQYNLQEGQIPGKRLIAYDNPSDENYGNGHVVSNGSLTKILFPSLRLGWIEASPWIRKQFICRPDASIGGGYNAFNQRLAVMILKNKNLPAHLTFAISFYAGQMKLGCDFLRKNLPKEVKFTEPAGSFFIWLEMPVGCDSKLLADNLKPYGISICIGENYSPERNFQNCLRINMSTLPEEGYILSLGILCKEMKALVTKYA